jgi:dTDP-4-dehydrorhamnose reductase
LEDKVKTLKLLVTGASGLLGHKVVQTALNRNNEVYSVYNEHPANKGNLIKLDLTNRSRASSIISKVNPQAIIHTAAYTDVDGCETNKDSAWKANVEATKNLVMSLGQNAHITFVSTDYVFDGNKGLYVEEDPVNPINYYGYTKLKGEELIRQHASEWCIARPSVIYGWGPQARLNFATWLISNLKEGREVNVLTDQYVSPTLNTNVAEMLLEIAQKRLTGVLHTAGATRVDRYQYALSLAEICNLRKDLIKPTKMNEMQWKAKRPRDSSLDVSKASDLLNQRPLELHKALDVMRKENPETS